MGEATKPVEMTHLLTILDANIRRPKRCSFFFILNEFLNFFFTEVFNLNKFLRIVFIFCARFFAGSQISQTQTSYYKGK